MRRIFIAILIAASATGGWAQRLQVEERVGELRFTLTGVDARQARVIVADGATTRTSEWKAASADRLTSWSVAGLGVVGSTWRVWLETPEGRRLTHDGVRTPDAIELISPQPQRVIEAARQALGDGAERWLDGLRRVAIALYNYQIEDAKAEAVRKAEEEKRRIEAQRIDAARVGIAEAVPIREEPVAEEPVGEIVNDGGRR